MGAMKFVAGQAKVALPADAKIDGAIGIGQIPNGFGIEVALNISLPGLDRAVAQGIIDKRTSCVLTPMQRAAIST
jgi:osmotically inducible protein OsmC